MYTYNPVTKIGFHQGLSLVISTSGMCKALKELYQLCIKRTISFIQIDHEIFSRSFSLELLIQEGFLSATSKNMCLKYGLTA